MIDQKQQWYFLLFILAGTFVLTFFIFRPFLYALALAMVFATVFQPVYRKIAAFFRGRERLAALTTILIILVLIFAPFIFLGIQIFQEARQLYFALTNGGEKSVILDTFKNLIEDFQRFFPVAGELSMNMDQYLKQGLSWLLQHLGAVFSKTAGMLVSSFIFFVALYYLLKDSHKLKKAIVALSPLTDDDDETIFKKLETAVNSVIKGNLAVALIQGALTAVGFAIFGVPNPVLWGTVAAISALIPGIGTSLVLIPAIIFLFLTGSVFSAFGLLVWSVLAVGLVDNFLGPKLIGRGTQLHPLAVFLSVIGGMIFFGPLGFFLGPLTLTLFFALLDIYSSLVKIKST